MDNAVKENNNKYIKREVNATCAIIVLKKIVMLYKTINGGTPKRKKINELNKQTNIINTNISQDWNKRFYRAVVSFCVLDPLYYNY